MFKAFSNKRSPRHPASLRHHHTPSGEKWICLQEGECVGETLVKMDALLSGQWRVSVTNTMTTVQRVVKSPQRLKRLQRHCWSASWNDVKRGQDCPLELWKHKHTFIMNSPTNQSVSSDPLCSVYHRSTISWPRPLGGELVRLMFCFLPGFSNCN